MLCLRCGAENSSNSDHCIKCKASLRRICPRCRSVNHQKQSFCGNCGLKLIHICPRCKALNSPLQKFCGNCGLKIQNLCPQCNTINPIGQKFCGNCSAKLIVAESGKNLNSDENNVNDLAYPSNQSTKQTQHKQTKTMTPPQPIIGEKPSSLPPQKNINKEMSATAVKDKVEIDPITVKSTLTAKNIITEPPIKPSIKEEDELYYEETDNDKDLPETEEIQETKLEEEDYSLLDEIEASKEKTKEASIEIITSKQDNDNHRDTSIIDSVIEEEDNLTSVLDDSETEVDLLSVSDEVEEENEEEYDREELSTNNIDNNTSPEDENKQIIEEVKPVELLSRFSILSIEIVNYPYLQEKLDKQLLGTIREKIWSNINNIAINYGEKLILVSDNLGVISFVHSVDLPNSAITSIKSSAESLKLMQILNQQLLATYNIQIKLKIGIALNDSQGNSEIERSIASEWSIVVSEEIKSCAINLCNFTPIGPLPIGNKMVSFYKVVLPQMEIQSMDETLTQGKQKQPEPKKEEPKQEPPKKEAIAEKSQPSKEKVKPTDIKHLSKDGAVSHFLNVCHLANSSGKGQLISLIAEDGYGKSTVIRTLRSSISPESFTWMTSRCNFQDHLAPLSTIKNLLRSFLGLSIYANNKEEARSIIKKAVESIFGQNDQLVFLFNSLLLEDQVTGLNKQLVINSIYNLIKGICEKITPIIIIEDIEFIDKASFEIIETLLKIGLTNSKIIIIITHQPSLDLNEVKPDLINAIKYSQVILQKADKTNIDYIIQEIVQTNINLPSTIKEQLVVSTQGVPLAVESTLVLMNDLEVIKTTNEGPVFNEEAINWQVPENFQSVLGYLFTRVSQSHPEAFALLQQTAILGPKISYKLLEDMSNQIKNFENELQTLFFLGYLTLEDTNTIIFKHNLIWEFVYYACITDEVRPQKHLQVLNHLEQSIEDGGYVDLGFIAYQSEMSGKKKKSLNYWNQLANHNLSLGVLTGYTDVMIHYLTLLDEANIPNRDEFKIKTLEGIASVAYTEQPDIAIQCLTSIIPVYEQSKDLPKLIEARGYLSYCYETQGKWDDAVIEIDKALELMPDNTMAFDKILLQVSKLSSLLSLGKLDKIISLCNESIFPAIESALINKSIPANISEEQLFSIYVNAKSNYANALITLGSSEALKVFDSLKQQLEQMGLKDTYLQLLLINARALSTIGDIRNAESLLSQSRELISKSPIANLLWNLWGESVCYNCLESGNFDLLLQIVNAIKSQPENKKDIMLTALIMYCDAIMEEISGNIIKSKELFNELINYASTYKLASFALKGWYHMSYLDMKEKRFDNAEAIANRALEVANMDGIKNVYSIAMLNRLLGEIKIRTGDLRAAKDYLDKAVNASDTLNNPSLKAKLSLTFGYLHIEMITHFEENKQDNANHAKDHLLYARKTFTQFGNKYQLYPIEKAIESLSMVAKVNSIAL